MLNKYLIQSKRVCLFNMVKMIHNSDKKTNLKCHEVIIVEGVKQKRMRRYLNLFKGEKLIKQRIGGNSRNGEMVERGGISCSVKVQGVGESVQGGEDWRNLKEQKKLKKVRHRIKQQQ